MIHYGGVNDHLKRRLVERDGEKRALKITHDPLKNKEDASLPRVTINVEEGVQEHSQKMFFPTL